MYRQVTEGKTRLLEYKPPKKVARGTYIPKTLSVFFNPGMHYSRDVGVLFAALLQKKHGKRITIADLLASSGARGLRYAKEVKSRVYLNDLNPKAVKLVQKSIELNKLKNCIVSQKDANILMLEHKEKKFDMIDIDPFGAPSRYFDAAFKSILRRNGLLSVIATDLGALKGRHPNACMRKYFSKSLATDFPEELAVRIMLSNALMHAAENDVCFDSVYAYTHSNHARVFLSTISTPKKINQELSRIGYFAYCRACGNRSTGNIRELEKKCSFCGKQVLAGGPVYLGPLFDKELLRQAFKTLREEKHSLENYRELSNALWLAMHEGEELFYHDVHKLSKLHKIVPRKMVEVIQDLENKGYTASRSSFSFTGIKTNAPFKQVVKALKQKKP